MQESNFNNNLCPTNSRSINMKPDSAQIFDMQQLAIYHMGLELSLF